MRKQVLALMGMALLVACGGDGSGDSGPAEAEGAAQAAGSSMIEAQAVDFGYIFDGESYPAGQIEITLTNEGDQPHQAVLYKLNDGVDVNEYKAAVMADQSKAPQLSAAVAEGIRKAIGPGETDISTSPYEADPGTYALICWLPDQTGKTSKNHAELGMIESFTVR